MENPEEPSLTMKYMNRFGCIGAACEENCCGGWRVDVDKEHYDKVMAMSQFSAKPVARRFRSAFVVVPKSKKTEPDRYLIKQYDNGDCFLLKDGWCELHGGFGYDALPHVCAFYPRKLKYVGETAELSATGSCPEIVRQILLPTDAVELEPIDYSRVHRKVLQDGMDPRDLRPFFRTFIEVRGFVMGLLRDPTLTWEQAQFLMLWFSKRTTEVLEKGNSDPDTTVVRREIEILGRPQVRHEIIKRYANIQAPAAMVLMIVRGIVRPKWRAGIRPHWNNLSSGVINSYMSLAETLPQSDDPEVHDRAAEEAAKEPASVSTIQVFIEYKRRRQRLDAIPAVKERIEGFFRRYSIHTWFHRMPIEENNILTYTLRTLTQMAAMKFLFYSQLSLQDLVTAYENAAEAEKPAAMAALMTEVEKQAVSVFYQIARHVEHGVMLKWFADMLKKMDFFSAAGGVYLIQF